MANVNFEVDVGLKANGVLITTANNTITSTGNIVMGGLSLTAANNSIITTGNIVINNAFRNTSANSVPTTAYVQNMAVVFGI